MHTKTFLEEDGSRHHDIDLDDFVLVGLKKSEKEFLAQKARVLDIEPSDLIRRYLLEMGIFSVDLEIKSIDIRG